MVLTIMTTHQPATDLGYLRHKHPDRVQAFDLSLVRRMFFIPKRQVEAKGSLLDAHFPEWGQSPYY